MYKYEIIIHWSDKDQAFIAQVPELQGCFAHGASPDEALSQVKIAMELWLATAKEFAEIIPEAKERPAFDRSF